MEKIIVGGTYEHFKTGKLYKVIGIAKHSETLEELVIYEAQYDNPASKLWARPIAMFLQEVEFEGKKQLRFKLIDN